MPDRPWEQLNAADSDAWESEYQDPQHSYHSPTRRDRHEETRPDGTRVATETLVIADVTRRGGAFDNDLVHYCDRCDGHEHRIRAVQGWAVDVAYTPIHVADGKFGQGRGLLYSSIIVTGTLTRRTETRTRPAGGGATHVAVVWETKVLDHTEQRDLVELEPFDSIVDCTLGIEDASFGYAPEGGELFAMALGQVPGLAVDVAWRDEGEVAAALTTALRGVERPVFRYGGDAKRPEMVVLSRTATRFTELGRVSLEISRDGATVSATGYRAAKRGKTSGG
ncbi:MAG: hypothetical protein U9Q74_11420 [Gemmatimonadota bacterium]|nr:hypothetical protein [Gemmatimonadota bacterium]